MQNKPNFRSAKTNATPFAAKVYETTPPPPHSKKQTQSNPNKPNFKMGNINISTEIITAYADEQRTINNERPSKQTQFIAAKPMAKPERTQPVAAKPCAKPDHPVYITRAR